MRPKYICLRDHGTGEVVSVSKDKLQVFEGNFGFYVAWFLADECDGGARLGDGYSGRSRPPPENREDYECWLSERVAYEIAADAYVPGRGVYLWDSRTEASRVLRVINERLKQPRDLPDWAKKALAEGWKPPKGWQA